MPYQYRMNRTEVAGISCPAGELGREGTAFALTVQWAIAHFEGRAFSAGEFLSEYEGRWNRQGLGPDWPPPTERARLRARFQRMWETRNLLRREAHTDSEWRTCEGSAAAPATQSAGPAAAPDSRAAAMQAWLAQHGLREGDEVPAALIPALLAFDRELGKRFAG